MRGSRWTARLQSARLSWRPQITTTEQWLHKDHGFLLYFNRPQVFPVPKHNHKNNIIVTT